MTKYILDNNATPHLFDEIDLDISSPNFNQSISDIKREYSNELNLSFKVYSSESIIVTEPYVLDSDKILSIINPYKSLFKSTLIATVLFSLSLSFMFFGTNIERLFRYISIESIIIGIFLFLATLFITHIALKIRKYCSIEKSVRNGSLILKLTQLNIYDNGEPIKSEFLFKNIK